MGSLLRYCLLVVGIAIACGANRIPIHGKDLKAPEAYTYCQSPDPNPSVNTTGKTLQFVQSKCVCDVGFG